MQAGNLVIRGDDELEDVDLPFEKDIGKRDPKGSQHVKQLAPPGRKRLQGLMGVSIDYKKLEEAYQNELLGLMRSYEVMAQPLLERRKQILTGEDEVTEVEVKAGEEQTVKDHPEATPFTSSVYDGPHDTKEDIKGIPDFWLVALKNHPNLQEIVTDRDEEALRSLMDIHVEHFQDKPGFALSFEFAPNDFFQETLLVKTYRLKYSTDDEGSYRLTSVESTKITWKEGKDLTHEIRDRTQRHKITGLTRVVRKPVKVPSFFDFFDPPDVPADDAWKDMDEDKREELEAQLESDQAIGEILKDDLVQCAVYYFTDRVTDFEDYLEDDDD